MIINRKRNGGMEIDYLVFSIFRYKFWITRSKYFCKYTRIVIWKMSKNPNVGAEKTWYYKFG
jgi:hypothetical protein